MKIKTGMQVVRGGKFDGNVGVVQQLVYNNTMVNVRFNGGIACIDIADLVPYDPSMHTK